ncbi:MAG TPA: sodium:solute symporter [Terriglobia bacterium]|nr:sodium:solute symporter [Terriglobia bacterium]
MALRPVDLVVVIAYLVGITIFGARFRKSQHNLRDYFLGGRELPWWAITLSIVSAETSILTIISTPGIAYSSNMNFLQLIFGYLIGRVIVSFVLIPKFFSGEIFTAYQFVEKRFGHALKVFTAALFLISRALAEGVRVFAIAIVFEIIFKTGVLPAVVIVTVLTLIYTFEGGFTAVIWTDVVQLTIYLVGSIIALVLALHWIPGGWGTARHLASLSGNKLQVFNFRVSFHEPYVFLSGLIGGAFLDSASHGADQLIVQRLLAARTRRQSQAALLSSGLVILFQFALFLAIGVVLFTYYHYFSPGRSFQRTDQIYPFFVVHSLPAGLAGLLTAAIIAAGMANLSSALNALSSSSVMDFYRPWVRPNRDERHYMRVSRGMTIFWGAALIGFALVAHLLKESVLVLALTIASFPYGSMLGIFLLAVLVTKAHWQGTLVGAVTGLVALAAVMKFTFVAWTWYVAIGTVVTFFTGWAVSALWHSEHRSPAGSV